MNDDDLTRQLCGVLRSTYPEVDDAALTVVTRTKHRRATGPTTFTLAAVVTVMVVVIAWLNVCGGLPRPTSASSTDVKSGAHNLGPVTESSSVHGSLLLAPPGATRPKLTWQQAIAACHHCPKLDGASRVELALATTPNSGTSHRNRTFTPFADHLLSYVLITHGRCFDLGGPLRTVPPTPAPALQCTLYSVIDVNTGKWIMALG